MKNKNWFLYLTGFFSGMSVMAIELGASRLLAPYFSSSQIVWTIIIGTIMIAMALGNYLGGKMADKSKSPTKLFIFMLIAAIWTGLIPLVGKFVVAGVALLLATFITKNYLIWAALTSCLLVFVFPLLILGMVTPNLVRFAIDDNNKSGKTVGTIEALNTIGSIIGTFLPTFVTIPSVGTAITFVIFSSILFVICLIYFINLFLSNKKAGIENNKKEVRQQTILSIICLLSLSGGIASSSIGTAFWDDSILYEGESIYNYLRVEETSNSIILSTNVLFGVQSIKMKGEGLTGMYYDYALASPVMAKASNEPIEILILGLGTGTFASQCEKYFNNTDIEGVEIDQKIVDLAYKYFDMSDNIHVTVTDGRAYLDTTTKKYDCILVDAYQDITAPFQMTTVEFFSKVSDHISDKGNMIVNLNMYTTNEGGINDYLCGTINQVFDNVYTAKTNTGGIELFASNNYDCKNQLLENIPYVEDSNLRNMMKTVYNKLEFVEKNDYILTDDKAPIEALGMDVIDIMISEELKYLQEYIKGKSFKELMEIVLSGNF